MPVFTSMWFKFDWCGLEASSSAYGHERVANSLPFLAAATWMLSAEAYGLLAP